MGSLGRKRLWLLDMDGTLYLGDSLFPGTIRFLRTIRESGGRYIFMSNNSSRGTDAYVSRLRRFGILASPEDFLTIDLINDLNRLPEFLNILYEKDIPVYLMDDVDAVRHGGLMLILANDLENVGRFVAVAISKILNGAEAGSLPCILAGEFPPVCISFHIF